MQQFCCCYDLKWTITSNIGSERQENMTWYFFKWRRLNLFINSSYCTLDFTFSPEWVMHKNVCIITRSPPLDLFGYLVNVMHQVLFEVVRNIFHIQNNSGMEIMISVPWKENNRLLYTNKAEIRIKFLNHVITQDTERIILENYLCRKQVED